MTVSSLYKREKNWLEGEMAFYSLNTESKIVALYSLWANIYLWVSIIHQVSTRMRATAEVIVLL